MKQASQRLRPPRHAGAVPGVQLRAGGGEPDGGVGEKVRPVVRHLGSYSDGHLAALICGVVAGAALRRYWMAGKSDA